MKRRLRLLAASATSLVLGAGAAAAQDVTLRIHHFLPPHATIQAQVFVPWCDRIGKESGGRIKCQIYPAMQLGGTPPQLFDQARDGVADIIWTLPTYQAGRFAKSEVFELPFMVRNAEGASPALWEYIQKNALDEYKGVKLLAAHVHDGSLLHFANKRVTTLEEMKGQKVRAPSRVGARIVAALGAAPVQMPLPQVPESVSKGVIDGAMVPWEGVPPIKLQEIARYHVDGPAGQPRISNSIFVIAMNQAKYDGLPADLKKVIDANSGIGLSRQVGKAYDAATEPAKRLAAENKGVLDTLSQTEYERWAKQTESVTKEWQSDVAAKGGNGSALYEDAKALIKKNGG